MAQVLDVQVATCCAVNETIIQRFGSLNFHILFLRFNTAGVEVRFRFRFHTFNHVVPQSHGPSIAWFLNTALTNFYAVAGSM
jgi:hypothetical protein